MDHLFHKNILQEKSNLEWQLAEANAKIEKLQRTISSLEEKKTYPPWYKPFKNAPGYPEPVQGKDGRWYSPKPKPPETPDGPAFAFDPNDIIGPYAPANLPNAPANLPTPWPGG
jgi:hypothetical protein